MNKINPELIIGLGNPGKEYENTRHNVGFLFIDQIKKSLDIKEFKFEKKLFAEIAETEFLISNFQFSNKFQIPNSKNKYKILLAKPQTMMNNSGRSVKSIIENLKFKIENLIVVHDDIDILWGNFKFSFGRSSAGHKGVASIIKALKTKNFWRLRIGIQPVRQAQGKPSIKKRVSADKIILKKFTPAELKILDQTIKEIIHTLSPDL